MKNYFTVIIFAAFLILFYVKISGKEHESTFGALWDTGSHFGAFCIPQCNMLQIIDMMYE